MGWSLTFLSAKVVQLTSNPQMMEVYIPLSAREIPQNELSYVIDGWLQPELQSARVFLDADQAINSQSIGPGVRYFHADGLRVVVVARVPEWLVFEDEDGAIRIDLRHGKHHIELTQLLITSKLISGHPDEKFIDGDLPFNMKTPTVHEILALEPEQTFYRSARPG